MESVSDIVTESLDDCGFTDPAETIPGLVEAIIKYANGDDQLLDEAAEMLADGGA